MGKYICHKDGIFFEWSTIVDAPVTNGMTEKEFRAYYKDEHGRRGLLGLEDRLQRAIERGTSGFAGESLENLIFNNRAGPDETTATLEDIMQQLYVSERTDHDTS
jgi:hypothetical protein